MFKYRESLSPSCKIGLNKADDQVCETIVMETVEFEYNNYEIKKYVYEYSIEYITTNSGTKHIAIVVGLNSEEIGPSRMIIYDSSEGLCYVRYDYFNNIWALVKRAEIPLFPSKRDEKRLFRKVLDCNNELKKFRE